MPTASPVLPSSSPGAPSPAAPSTGVAPPLAATRIGGLDTYRFLTVTLALLSHALLEFSVSAVTDPSVWLVVRSVTRSATPGLLVLFGVMAEVVHYRRYRLHGRSMLPRLTRRMWQCYAAFVGLSVLVALTRPEPPLFVVRSLGFLTLEGYTVIFALYFLLLLALRGVLPLRHRYGFGGLAGLVAAVWAVGALVVARLPLAHDTFKALADVALGRGGAWGPSAFHSLTLLVAGMAFGNVLYTGERSRGDRSCGDRSLAARALAGAFVAASVLLVGREMALVGVHGFFEGITDLSKYRAHNAPVYYAYGILGAALTIPVAYALDALLPSRLLGPVHGLGGKTFSYFVLGNVLLILCPPYAATSAGGAVALVAGFLVLSAALTLGWSRGVEAWRGEGARGWKRRPL